MRGDKTFKGTENRKKELCDLFADLIFLRASIIPPLTQSMLGLKWWDGIVNMPLGAKEFKEFIFEMLSKEPNNMLTVEGSIIIVNWYHKATGLQPIWLISFGEDLRCVSGEKS